ncbi:hypothetical protein RZS08_05520 [Arthrospira platensis SPKY1]|nr:hypothetical protein [Arthrospira platensis SPKY1]
MQAARDRAPAPRAQTASRKPFAGGRFAVGRLLACQTAVDFVHHRRRIRQAVYHQVGAGAGQPLARFPAQPRVFPRRQRRQLRFRQADLVAGDGHAHAPRPGVQPLLHVGRRVADFEHGRHRVHVQRLRQPVYHPGRRPPGGYVAGADHRVHLQTVRPGRREQRRHHLPVVAGAGADL